MSAIYLGETEGRLPHGIRIRLERADRHSAIHNVVVAQEIPRVIKGDAEFHGVEYDGSGWQKIFSAYKHGKIRAYFLVVERENCDPIYAGGAIQFPAVITEWNGKRSEHFAAFYSEDTWVDRAISDEVRNLTVCPAFPKGVGLGGLNSQGRIILSSAGVGEDLPYGMIAKGRLSENASDNGAQLHILSKLGCKLNLEESAVLQFDDSNIVKRSKEVEIETSWFATPDIDLLPDVFRTAWSSVEGDHEIVGTHFKVWETTTGKSIVRSDYTGNKNLPPPEILKKVMASMIFATQAEILKQECITENECVGQFNLSPVIRVHAHEQCVVSALRDLGGKTRYFGSHTMIPAAFNYDDITDSKLRSQLREAEPLDVVRYTSVSRSIKPGFDALRYGKLAAS